ncbi:hypothetical protein [Lentiprolixibacter aurantiacus]|uniref:Uncharacterized protein n=1 Tax=Lentiprolixibacter aurantiacus TaxID=2993939 RepID=A0AAE3MJ60_9FLAO|nr:hypothetical protein [Lentiprolixibacter aurantiacus]MCX2718548.1 hypothetical protein [Lentiprolixibacter aurantiacus]
MLKIGSWVVIISLSLYLYWYWSLGMSWGNFVSFTTWNAEYMPTGFSNMVLNLQSGMFERIGGNHGIYGSYLVLLLILAIFNLQETHFRRSKIFTLLILINISFLTSRETLLLLILTFGFYCTYIVLLSRFSKRYVYLTLLFLFIGTISLLIWQPDVVLFNKIEHMLSSFSERGRVDNNVSYRLNTWYLFFQYIWEHPQWILLGFGFNRIRFEEILSIQEQLEGVSLAHVSVPESFYVGTLAYGGIFSLFCGILFFVFLLIFLGRRGKLGILLFFYVVGLMLTNGTGSSVLAELMLSQLGLVYLYVQKNLG